MMDIAPFNPVVQNTLVKIIFYMSGFSPLVQFIHLVVQIKRLVVHFIHLLVQFIHLGV